MELFFISLGGRPFCHRRGAKGLFTTSHDKSCCSTLNSLNLVDVLLGIWVPDKQTSKQKSSWPSFSAGNDL